jgi:hypothetical protein
MSDYDPQSLNAMLSRIIERLDKQDRESADHRREVKETLQEIKAQTTLTNGRVTWIERWIEAFKARMGTIVFIGSALVSLVAWVIERVWQ